MIQVKAVLNFWRVLWFIDLLLQEKEMKSLRCSAIIKGAPWELFSCNSHNMNTLKQQRLILWARAMQYRRWLESERCIVSVRLLTASRIWACKLCSLCHTFFVRLRVAYWAFILSLLFELDVAEHDQFEVHCLSYRLSGKAAKPIVHIADGPWGQHYQ